MDKAILTVIVFAYNHEKTIANCLDHILSQKTNYKYDIYISDDASTDKTTEICREYSNKYPDKIKLVVQEKNTYKKPYRQTHFFKTISKVDTKYWCYIDGDDHWCDDNFIQVAIDSLENNPSCSTFCCNFITECKDSSYKGISEKIETGIYKNQEIKWDHPSARIHKTLKDFAETCRLVDSFCFYYYLFQGDVYYDKRIMSIYNYNGEGVWSKISKKLQQNLTRAIPFRMCQIYNFEHEDFWFKLMHKKDRRKIRFLKLFCNVETAWYVWFIVNIVPLFGWESLNKEWRR